MTKVKEFIFRNTRLMTALLFGVCTFSLILYIFAINLTVRNVVKREAMETELSYLSTRISELEFQYIHLKNSITLDYAKKIGFESTTETKYVSRKTSVAMADFEPELTLEIR